MAYFRLPTISVDKAVDKESGIGLQAAKFKGFIGSACFLSCLFLLCNHVDNVSVAIYLRFVRLQAACCLVL